MGLDRRLPAVNQETLDHALGKALVALRHEATPKKVAEFYDPESNYAGATFIALEPREATAATATDLIATTMLSVKIPPRAVRRVLEDSEISTRLSQLLSELPQHALEDTSAHDFDAMCAFYDELKETLAKAGVKSSNPWVTASKLAARKRPDLFPVRDNKVCNYLGIERLRDREKDWFVFRELLRSREIAELIRLLPERVREVAESAPLELDTEPLRILDAVLWRHSGGGGTEAQLMPSAPPS